MDPLRALVHLGGLLLLPFDLVQLMVVRIQYFLHLCQDHLFLRNPELLLFEPLNFLGSQYLLAHLCFEQLFLVVIFVSGV